MHFFYEKNISGAYHYLHEENVKHALQVLRMKMQEPLTLTDGCGNLYSGYIESIEKKQAKIKIEHTEKIGSPSKIHLAIAFTKNASRIEWMLEKITEIGIAEITPLITKRSERHFFKKERFEKILISAMCQSQQAYLPILHEPKDLGAVIVQSTEKMKYIAHCINTNDKISLHHQAENSIILIGPEGDFTADEIQMSLAHNFVPITLGNSRLRTETAGLVAVTLLNLA